jgi:hypothetical protein
MFTIRIEILFFAFFCRLCGPAGKALFAYFFMPLKPVGKVPNLLGSQAAPKNARKLAVQLLPRPEGFAVHSLGIINALVALPATAFFVSMSLKT